MKKITQDELKEILEKHKLWLENNPEGEKADLSDVDLRRADLSHADLRYTDLSYADLRYTDLRHVYLSHADLSHADLSHADLSYADLSYTDLSHADLSYADLNCADLRCTITYGVTGKDIISVRINTTRKNNIIAYWADLGVITTGCFQGTIKELKKQVQKTHKDNDFLRKRYERAIAFIENEANEDEIRRIKNN